MEFDAKAYAEGISNSAAGSSIETLIDAIDGTLFYLRRSATELRGLEPDEAEDVDQIVVKWKSLRDALANHPENTNLSIDHSNEGEEV